MKLQTLVCMVVLAALAWARPPDVICEEGVSSFWCPAGADPNTYYWCTGQNWEGFMPCPPTLVCSITGPTLDYPCAPSSSCISKTCNASGRECGQFFDGCKTVDCGQCPWDKVCTSQGICKQASTVYSCNPATCKLPNCRCCDESIPADLALERTPQFILLTFDDSLDSQFVTELESIVGSSVRDAGHCPIAVTFFLYNGGTNYTAVIEAHKNAEIACHTHDHITGTDMTVSDWETQIQSGRSETVTATDIPASEMIGFRAPYMYPHPAQLQALKNLGYLYDNSFSEDRQTNDLDTFIWPCTLDNGLPHLGGRFDHAYPHKYTGLWEIPVGVIDDWYDMDPAGTPEENLEQLKRTFNEHYSTNRAPMGVWLHPAWLRENMNRTQTLIDFFTWATTQHKGVFFATGTQLIHWIQDPIDAQQLACSGGLCDACVAEW